MRSPAKAPNILPHKVLIIDDEEEFHQYLETIQVFDNRFDVLKAYTPQEALKLLNKNTVDLVLLDLFLLKEDEPDGLDLIPKIKKINPSVAICAISKGENNKIFIKAISRGVDFFLRKTEIEGKIWKKIFLDIISENESKDKHKPQILVVDDEEDFYHNLQYSFLNEFSFDFAMSFNQARKMLEVQQYDSIILDIHFGDESSLENGFTFYQNEIKEKTPFQQVIIASKESDEDYPVTTGRMGIPTFLDKNKFDRKKWLKKIQKNLSLQKQPKIFISHASSDKRQYVNKIHKGLIKAKTVPILDSQEFIFGSSLLDQIAVGIYSCNLFLLVLSKNSTKADENSNIKVRTLTEWIYEEHEFALNLQRCGHIKKILPIFLDKEAMNAEIKTKDNGIGVVKDLKLAPCFFPMDGETEEEAYQRGFDQLLQALKEYR